MVKYKEMFAMMCEQNKEQFESFKKLCERYMGNKAAFKEQFDREGKEVLATITMWEQKLCRQMERGSKGVYSSNLSEKFWGEIRKVFPLIDEVGVKKTFVKV